jgi:drug/metabolite transporter (DMT)-like permease
MPLFGVALAFSILGERLAPRAILGSAIVLFATLILFRFDTPSDPAVLTISLDRRPSVRLPHSVADRSHRPQ